MAAEPVAPPRSIDFREASPKEVRAAIVPEEQADFDRQWRNALKEAAESLELDCVYRILDSWRRRAMITTYLGHNGYREMLARAEERLRTGEEPPDSVPLEDIKELIAERLGR
ncbi:DUF6247 family protein [Actinophytocola sp.]|uniref:DUF6247 family protein n=1 Tax=Actinophytocola sp. TaxID=1872138 RepID=UPI002ED03EE6